MTALNAQFTGTDGTAIAGGYTADSGHTFAVIQGTTATLYSNMVYGSSYGLHLASPAPASSDCAIEMSFKFISQNSTSQVAVALRTTTTAGYTLYYLNGVWSLYARTSSGEVLVTGGTYAQTLTSGSFYKAKLQAVGSTLKFWTDNGDGTYVLRATCTDTRTASGGSLAFYSANTYGVPTQGMLIDYVDETAVEASAITLTGPSTGTSGVASSNFTVGTNGAITGTVVVTPSDGGAGGTFTPTTVSLTSGSPTGTFTYTPSSTGAKTISVTNSAGLSNPSSLTYTVTAAATAVTLTGPTSGVTGTASTNFTVGANGTIVGTVIVTPSDGGAGGTFTPTTISISSGSPTGTFTYTPSSVGTKAISVTNNGSLSNPSSITYTSNPAPATAVTLTGPTTGASGVASSNFTVGANGAITGTIIVTPSDSGGGGTFTPSTVSISSGAPTATFTYTPASSGAKTLSVTNNGGLSNPSSISYTVTSGPATAVTVTGPSFGTNGIASTPFTVGANGSITGTIVVTPSDGGAGGTFSPTSASISSGTPNGTFTYTAASSGAKTISVTNSGGLSNPSALTYTSSAPGSGTLTFIGPSAGTVSVASAAFTAAVVGTVSGTLTVTPSDGGAGGTFTPTTVSLTSSAQSATFTYTPASTGTKTISVTNNGGFTNPSSITFVSAASSTLAAGAITLGACTTSTINLMCAAATGGTSPYTYEWHRKTDPGEVIGAHNKLAGATSLTLADSSGLLPDTVYWYVCRAIDSTGAVADQKLIAGTLLYPDLVIGFLGDSITAGQGLSAGQTPPDGVATALSKMYHPRNVVVNNQGHGGSTTADWAPGGTYLNTARTAWAAAGVTLVHIMLGANDSGAGAGMDASVFKTNLQAIVTQLLTDGYKIVISYPIFMTDGPPGFPSNTHGLSLKDQYRVKIDELVNNTTVFRGDTAAFKYFVTTYQAEFQTDYIHPNATGAANLGKMWARAIDRALSPLNTPSPTRTVTCTFVDRFGTPQANLTGLSWLWADTKEVPIDSGTGSTDASGVFTITVHSYLPVGGIGFLRVTNAAGSINTTYLSFAGPAAVF